MTTKAHIALCLLIGLSGMPLAAQVQAARRYLITPHQIAQSLRSSGMDVADGAVSLPAEITSSEPEALLDVQSVVPVPGEPSSPKVRLRLACRTATACLPFYAIVMTSGATTQWNQLAASKSLVTQVQSPSIRAGSAATLILSSKSMRIKLQVLSLENGVIGCSVHVTSLDHKQKYVATVVSPVILEGEL